ncbi:hypothetical protein [Pontibacter akesuensis]|uniref:Uncharacterized protein n=1 Tax=Pontibacter akesuensis TaxID=388950 RepID=A0A1I7K918_9BACT|nr:hypothetical protein [Pontibacter akesuensis]GHA74179.1 hypothetical protein GCM10007389_29790 [Pontibacter akesuensis]SFU93865.1 hypothetical protein SAMN04487941_3529 [Pontibacter akesuensis]
MANNLRTSHEQTIRTECGRTFGCMFRAIKLMRDEKHWFHMIYRTFENEYIYAVCNPFLDSDAITYHLISEAEAKRIFLPKLSADNARELFPAPTATVAPIRL